MAVLISFIPMQHAGHELNIMSLAGSPSPCGELVDAAIVVVEQTHKKLEIYERTGKQFKLRRVILEAVKEVAGPSFFALLVIAVSFLPVLTLEGQEGRLFKPLAYTKNFAMMVAAVLAITLDPALRLLLRTPRRTSTSAAELAGSDRSTPLLVGKIHPEEKHPISRSADAALRAGGALDPALEDGW